MFGIDFVELIPGGTIQDMVQSNGPELVNMAMQAARSHYQLADNERMSFQFIETTNGGKPTVIMLPLVVDARTLQTLRKLPYYDVPTFLRTAPVAKWVRTGKDAKKTAEDVEKLAKKLEAAKAKGDTAKVQALDRQLGLMLDTLPEGVRKLIGGPAPKPQEAPPVPMLRLDTAPPAAEQGDAPEPETETEEQANDDGEQ